MLYFCTLGVCGVGWLADIYWQRKFLFGGAPISKGAAAAGGSVSGKGVLKRGKDLLKNSTFGEQWRRNRDERRNRHQRLDDDVEGGGGTELRTGRGRGGRLGKGGGRKGVGESCGEDDEEVDDRLHDAPTETADVELYVSHVPHGGQAAQAGAAGVCGSGDGNGDKNGGGGIVTAVVLSEQPTPARGKDDFDELAIHEPMGPPRTAL